MTLALPCACALTLGCLASLLVSPSSALDDEVHLQQSPEPRMASWFANFGQINKYMEKLFSSGLKKAKNHKTPSDSTITPPSDTTVRPHLNGEKPTPPPPPQISKLQALEPHRLQLLGSSHSPSADNKEK